MQHRYLARYRTAVVVLKRTGIPKVCGCDISLIGETFTFILLVIIMVIIRLSLSSHRHEHGSRSRIAAIASFHFVHTLPSSTNYHGKKAILEDPG